MNNQTNDFQKKFSIKRVAIGACIAATILIGLLSGLGYKPSAVQAPSSFSAQTSNGKIFASDQEMAELIDRIDKLEEIIKSQEAQIKHLKTPEDKTREGWKVYTNETFGISFSYPTVFSQIAERPGYVAEESQELLGAKVVVSNPDIPEKPQFFVSVNHEGGLWTCSNTVVTYNVAEKSNGDLEIIDKKTTHPYSNPGPDAPCSGGPESQDTSSHVVVIRNGSNGKNYFIVGATEESNSILNQQIEEMIESVRIIN